MSSLKTKDLRLLAELDENARRPASLLSRNTKMSQQLVGYKIKKFLRDRVIWNFYAQVDYAKLGYLRFSAHFKILYISKEHVRHLISHFINHPSVVCVEECGGRWDLVVTYMALNPSHFNKVLKETMHRFPKQLRECTVLTTVVIHEFARKYLPKRRKPEKQGRSRIVGGDRDYLQLEETDRRIVHKLLDNARASATEIAREIGLTANTVIQHRKRLVKSQLIKGYRPLLSLNRLGYGQHHILIRYHNLSADAENSILEYCRINPYVVRFTKTLGLYDLWLDLETTSPLEFRSVCVELREKYGEIIQDFESFPVYRVYYRSYLPQEYFQ
jgi:Lrp/AsnC family leucine-responsive transcriptional regulator